MVDSIAALVPLSDLNPCFVARFAKERRLRIWRDYINPCWTKDKQFVAKVSHSEHLALHCARCQASDNTEIWIISPKAEAFLLQGKAVTVHVCVYVVC